MCMGLASGYREPERKSMLNPYTKQYYYKLCNGNEDETLYTRVNAHIKADKLTEFMGMSDMGYTAEEITKEEYEREAEQE